MSRLGAFHLLQERALASFRRPDVLSERAFDARRRLLLITAVGFGAAVILPGAPALVSEDVAANDIPMPALEVSLAVLKLERAVGNIYESMPSAPSPFDLDDASDALRTIRGDIKEALDQHRPAAAAVMAERVVNLSVSELGHRATMHGIEFNTGLPIGAMRESKAPSVVRVLQRLDQVPPAAQLRSEPRVLQRMKG